MKSATRNLTVLALTASLAAAALGWLPEQKGKRKMRMADTAQVVSVQQA